MKFLLPYACHAALVAVLCTAADAAPTAQPNIVLIMADDMGYSDLGCYGGEIDTPNLDGLAAGGLRFTQFYNSGRCWPTRAALLTGYYAQQVRRDAIPGEPKVEVGQRPDWAPLLPELLNPRGYRSYHSGKWHLDRQPLQSGFDRSYALYDTDRFFRPNKHTEDDRPLPRPEDDADYYATTAIADFAIRVLQAHAAEHGDRPFFQYVAFTSPHFPLHARQEDIERYRETYRRGWERVRQARWERLQQAGIVEGKLPEIERDIGPPYEFPKALEALGPGEVNRPLPWEELNEQQAAFQAAKMAVHAAMVDRMDREIGRIVGQLRDMGVLDNTLILFLSDNGASAEIMVRGDGHDRAATPGSAASYLCLGPGWSTASNTPFRRHKTWVHEGGIATPLIVHWPAGIQAAGQLRHNPGHAIDIVPTILELAGSDGGAVAPNAPPRPSKSLLPAFQRDGSVAHDSLWWLHEGNRAIRAGDWKLVAAADAPWELYNLAVDRTESQNLAEQHPDRVRELERTWTRLREEYRRHATADLGQPASEQSAKSDPPSQRSKATSE